MKKYLLPENGTFYKANLHCHSTFSDGKWTPEEIKEKYMRHGYSVVAFTDHRTLYSQAHLTDENFLSLDGYEIDVSETLDTGRGYKKTCHFCLIAKKQGTAQPDFGDEDTYTPENISRIMRSAREKGFFVTYNHPNWSLEDFSDYINYHGMDAMEIANYGCIAVGYQDYAPMVYDEMLRYGKKIFCVATDDNHNRFDEDSLYCDSFGGFTVIKADSLSYENIIRALEKGNFYASQGPEIKELWYEDGIIHIKTSPVKKIDFVFGSRRAKTVIAENDGFLEEAECEVPENSIYVRVSAKDEKGLPADTNAYFTENLK
ncbi:MAG: PHP domain-containing protein [Ruminococcaceae bacterium]|nr:PHP domain-containing protein [Oscillospiraceae bacterium]